jgi:hypothetical protein
MKSFAEKVGWAKAGEMRESRMRQRYLSIETPLDG